MICQKRKPKMSKFIHYTDAIICGWRVMFADYRMSSYTAHSNDSNEFLHHNHLTNTCDNNNIINPQQYDANILSAPQRVLPHPTQLFSIHFLHSCGMSLPFRSSLFIFRCENARAQSSTICLRFARNNKNKNGI